VSHRLKMSTPPVTLRTGTARGPGGLAEESDPRARGNNEQPLRDPDPSARLLDGLNRTKNATASRAVPAAISRRHGVGAADIMTFGKAWEIRFACEVRPETAHAETRLAFNSVRTGPGMLCEAMLCV